MTDSFTWEGDSATPAITTSGATMTIYSGDRSQAATYPVKLGNEITIASNGPGGSTTFTPAIDADKVIFDVVLVDPCTTATINALVFTPGSLSVEDGLSISGTFDVPTNSVMDTHSSTSLLCDVTEYALYQDNDGTDTGLLSTWGTITGPVGSTYTMSFDTSVDVDLIASETSVDHIVYVKSTLTSYNSQVTYTPITVTITQTGCDCSALLWVNPATDTYTVDVDTNTDITLPIPTSDDSNRALIPSFEQCYFAGSCATTGEFQAGSITYDGGSVPAWITFTPSGTSTQVLSINAPDGSHNGAHTLAVTYTTTHGDDPIYNAVIFTVQCTVATFTRPSDPSTENYDLFATLHTIDISSLVYVQDPACGYAYTDSVTWTGLETFISQASATDFVLEVYTNNVANSGSTDGAPTTTYTVSVQNTITISSNGPAGSVNFAPTGISDKVEFDVVINNPCW
jgi:hypothetical protein